jgi:putative ABC transport system permease protein
MAAIGVFGVFSFMVAARRREIGVRVALGASGFHIARVVMGAAGSALAVGLAAGIAASLTLTPVLRQYLYGLSPLDPIAFGAAALVLGGAAFLATADPVRRALRVDPVATLKQE